MMRSTKVLVGAGAAALLTTVAACGSSGSSGTSAPAASSGMTTSATSGGAAAAKAATLSVAKTSLGSIVTGPDGRTVYMFAKDTKGSGKSTCTGPCLKAWPPVVATGTPKTPGISGKVGTITTAGGKKQLTLGGWPLYYYAGDGSTGDVNGQGINGFGAKWWALNSNGAEVTKSASGGSSGGSGGGQGGGYGY